MAKILVAYASKHNATADIAVTLGEELRKSMAHHVDVRPVEEVESIASYDAVVLGSAVYAGQWQPAATSFLKRNEAELTRRPTWLFSSGPTGQGDPVTVMHGWKFPPALQPIADRIGARDIKVFGGRIDAEQLEELNLLERAVLKVVHPPLGDFRNWDDIRSWADDISLSLN